MTRYDVAIVGGGIVGLSAALAAGQAGARVVLIDRGPAPGRRSMSDGRTAALLDPAIAFLDRLGLEQKTAGDMAPLKALRIINLSDRRHPDADVTFRANEVGLDAFGYNISNDALRGALFVEASSMDAVTISTKTTVSFVEVDDDQAVLTFDDGRRIATRLMIAADGRHSAVRTMLGIDAHIQNYDQSAIVCSFDHRRHHDATSIELHRPGGPFTMVPLPGQRSSLVWVEPTGKADALMALDDDAFRQALDVEASPWLGKVEDVSARRSYPLSAVLAASITAPRTVLIGEAAHALSPIGAQGLNLSLQDVSILGDLIGKALMAGGDPGSASLLKAYRRKRMPDIRARYLAIDGLNRMVASDWRPIGLVRATGLRALGRLPFVRRRLMHAMMTPLELPGLIARMAA